MRAGLVPWLRLLRVGTLFSPAADVVAGLCLADLPWSASAARAAAASACCYAAGMVLNDHADRASDARLRPERPIPRGDIGPGAALAAGLALLTVALALAPSRGYYAALAGLVLAYDYLLKRWTAAGAAAMGALRGLNLAAGAVAVAAASPPREVIVAASAYAVYIAAVTLLGVREDDRQARPRAVAALQHVPPLVAVLALLSMPRPWPAAAVALVLAAAFLVRVWRTPRWDQAAIRASMTWLLLGTLLYAGLLCLAAGRPLEGAIVVAAAPAARWISRRIALT